MNNFFENIDWATITSFIVVLGLIISALIKLFSKSFITSLGEKTAELLLTKQKTEIEKSVETAFNKALAEYQSELDKKNIAFEADYTFYNTERSKVCIELYHKIVTFYDNALLFTSLILNNPLMYIDSQIGKTAEIYEKSLDDLRVHYNQNKIFLNKELSEVILTFFHNIGILCSEYSDEYVKLTKKKGSDKELKATYENLKQFYNRVREKQTILDKIADSISDLIQPKELKK